MFVTIVSHNCVCFLAAKAEVVTKSNKIGQSQLEPLLEQIRRDGHEQDAHDRRRHQCEFVERKK